MLEGEWSYAHSDPGGGELPLEPQLLLLVVEEEDWSTENAVTQGALPVGPWKADTWRMHSDSL